MSDNVTLRDGSGTAFTRGTKDISTVHHPYVIHTGTGGQAMPAGDAAARAIVIRTSDGTTLQGYVDVDAAIDERVDHFAPAAAALYGYDSGASAGSRSIPLAVATGTSSLLVTHGDGTNQMPAGDAAARVIHVRPSDGTTNQTWVDVDGAIDERTDHYTPVAAVLMGTDSAAGAGSKLVPAQVVSTAFPALKSALYSSAGTTVADATTVAAYLETAALVTTGPGEEKAEDSIVTGTTTPTATLAAVASTKYVVKSISISLACTADQVPLLFELVQDTAGTPLTLWSGTLAGLAKTSQNITLPGLNIVQTVANKALHLTVTSGTIVSTNFICVNFTASRTA